MDFKVLGLLATILLVALLYVQHSSLTARIVALEQIIAEQDEQAIPELQCPPPPLSSLVPALSTLDTFYAIATRAGTDKVTSHSYQNVYDKYLPQLRDRPIKMLEIGLGCMMGYGPGKSMIVWKEYFSTKGIDLHFIEIDGECVKKWQSQFPSDVTVWVGQQDDVTFLEKVKTETRGQFDLIVDDGGHTMNQQKISIQHLFEIVKPGGYYVIEDLQTSFMSIYMNESPTTIDWLKTMLDSFYVNNYSPALDKKPTATYPAFMKDVLSFECFYEVCIFQKKK